MHAWVVRHLVDVARFSVAPVFLLVGAANAGAGAPTFDCRVAALPAELRICLVPDLAQLDVEVAAALAKRQESLPAERVDLLQREQQAWLRQRNACRSDEACLRRQMQARLARLGDADQPGAGAGDPGAGRRANIMEERERRRAEANEERARRRAVAAEQAEAARAKEAEQRAVREAEGREQMAAIMNRPQFSWPPPPADALPDGAEWRGVYTCGRVDGFMRLVRPAAAAGEAPVTILQFGPGLESASERGAFQLAGEFPGAAGAFRLEPNRWWHMSHDPQAYPTFGLEGTRQADGRLTGKVIGGAACEGFRAWPVPVANEPENPAGLLLRLRASTRANMVSFTADECRPVAQWLAGSKQLKVGSYYVASGFYDVQGQRRVLGRSAEQWKPGDYILFSRVLGMCREQVERSASIEDGALVRSIPLFNVPPLDQPRESWTASWWDRAQLAAVLMPEARERAAAVLARLGGLPPRLDSLAAFDAGTAAAERPDGELRYLEEADRDGYKKAAAAARLALAASTVRAMSEAFAALPATTESLAGMRPAADALRAGLLRAKAPEAAGQVEAVYGAAVAAKAREVWPLFYAEAGGVLARLDGADYDRFPQLLAMRRREELLRSAAAGDAGADATYRAAYRAVLDGMLARSMERLVRWASALPPSAAANVRLDQFTSELFGPGEVPNRYAALRSAVLAKRAEYNPERYLRPDIVMSLRRRLWGEVSAEGLEDIAYFASALRALNEQCPGVLPPEGSAESNALGMYAIDASKRAVERLMRGEVRNQTEAQRAVFLGLNTFFNRPGCRVNGFGMVTSCTSAEDQSRAQAALLTSGDALADMGKLGAHGCGSEEVRSYVRGSMDFASRFSGQRGGVPIPAP